MIWLVLAFAFAGYGISIGWKNSGTFFYLIWFLFSIFCIGMYCQIKMHWIPLFIFRYIVGLLFICIFIGLFLLSKIFSQFHASGKPNLDYVLVLGAQYKVNGPSNALRFRLEKAFLYLNENKDTLCIVSGGQGYNEPCSEASGMKKYLIQLGIDSNRIIEEDQSTSTIENIQLSKKLMKDFACIGIVTNDFHMYRSLGIARKQGLNCVGIAARSTIWYQPNNIFREMFGIIKDSIKGNM